MLERWQASILQPVNLEMTMSFGEVLRRSHRVVTYLVIAVVVGVPLAHSRLFLHGYTESIMMSRSLVPGQALRPRKI